MFQITAALDINEKDIASEKLRERIVTAINDSPLSSDWSYINDISKDI